MDIIEDSTGKKAQVTDFIKDMCLFSPWSLQLNYILILLNMYFVSMCCLVNFVHWGGGGGGL